MLKLAILKHYHDSDPTSSLSSKVPDEKFLVVINDLLASGDVPGLFADDELENLINGLRNEVKGAGIQDTKENIWKFFIDRVRRQLKVSYGRHSANIVLMVFNYRLYCVSHPLVQH